MGRISDHILSANDIDSFRNWSVTYPSLPITGTYTCVASNGTTFVLAGSALPLRSTNGTTWVAASNQPIYEMFGICSKGTTNEFMAIGNAEFAWKSTDSGNTWTSASIASSAVLSGMRCIASNGARYVCVGSNFNVIANKSIAATSTNGTTWTTSTLPFSGNNAIWRSIASNGTNFVAAGNCDLGICLAVTSDGTTWIGILPGGFPFVLQGTPTVSSNGSRYVVIANNIAFSDNAGTTWTILQNQSFQGNAGNWLTADGSRFLCTALSNYALVSENGLIYRTKPISLQASGTWLYSCSNGPSYVLNNGPYIFVDYLFGTSKVARIAAI